MIYKRDSKSTRSLFFVALLLGIATSGLLTPIANAQSSNQDAPTPVTDNIISGRIAPRDIGDPRLTSHFFVLETQPGDLEVEVTSSELNGDIDLFLAGNLRPLAKVTLFATGSPTRISRTIFMREAAPVLLRVLARSSGDSTGTYLIRFGGAFLPSRQTANATDDTPAAPEREENATDAGTRRVTSVGGRIEETTERSNEAARVPALPDVDATDDASPAPTPTNVRKLPRRPSTSARRGTRLPRPPAARRPRPSARDSKSDEARATPAPKQAGVSRLIIRTRDGARVELSMSEVERVVVEGGELVVVLKNGEERRLALTEVLRFTIE